MELKVLKEDKELFEVELSSLTIAEVLRVYLNKDSDVKFAAWKRVHPTENPILRIEGKNPKKSLKNSLSEIGKDLDKVEKDFAKMK